jgi:hypothetical protein
MASSLLIFLLLLLVLVDHMRSLHEETAFGNFQDNVALLLFVVAAAVVVKDVLFSDFYLDVRRRWRQWRGRLLAGRGLPGAFLDFLTKEKRTINQKAKNHLTKNNEETKSIT